MNDIIEIDNSDWLLKEICKFLIPQGLWTEWIAANFETILAPNELSMSTLSLAVGKIKAGELDDETKAQDIIIDS